MLEPVAALGKAFKCRERLLERRPRFSVGRALDRPGARLPEIGNGFVPRLGLERVVCEPLDLFAHAVYTELFEDLHTSGVQRAAPFLEEAAIGHLVGEGMLEGVLELREQARLIEKLGGPEVGQAVPQLLFGQLRDRLEDGIGHILSDDRGHLEEALFLPRQPVDPGGQDRLDRGRHLDIVERTHQAVDPTFPDKGLRLDQSPDALLQEEGIPLRALDQEPLERRESAIVSCEGLEQLAGGLRDQRVEAELAVVGLVPPAVAGTRSGS